MQKCLSIAAVPTTFNATTGSLYALMVATSNFVPTGSILPDRCCGLKVVAIAGNTGTVTLTDSTNLGGDVSTASTRILLYDRQFAKNCIMLRDLFPIGSAASQGIGIIVDFE